MNAAPCIHAAIPGIPKQKNNFSEHSQVTNANSNN